MAQPAETQLSPKPFVTTTISPDKVAHLVLARKPVNTLNRVLWRSIRETIQELEENWYPHRVQCLVISSGLSRPVFSAGNDLGELYNGGGKGRESFREFWIESGLALTKLYTSRLVTICVVNGACAAGGCVIALCCDYRIGCRGMTIGLNEAKLGMPVPKFWNELLLKQIGHAKGEAMLTLGRMVEDNDALKIGLVDEIAGNQENGVRKALKVGQEWMRIDNGGREINKWRLRSAFAGEWRSYLEKEADLSYELLISPLIAEKLAVVRARLGAGKRKGKGKNEKQAKL